MRFSIIVPVYNVGSYLAESLDSVIGQDFPDWECICVDDGSTDGSAEILDAYAARDDRITVIHQANAGVSVARNVALARARGDWVTFLDPDDKYASKWLTVADDLIAKFNGVELIRLGSYFGATPSPGFGMDMCLGARKTAGMSDVLNWGYPTFFKTGYLWKCFVRRDKLEGLTFIPGMRCKEDGVFLVALLPRLSLVVEGDYVGYFYRRVGLSASRKRRSVRDCLNYMAACHSLWLQQKECAQENGAIEVLRKVVTHSVVNDIVEWMTNKKSNESGDAIRDFYLKIEREGIVVPQWVYRERFRLPFFFWERTGSDFFVLLVDWLFGLAGRIKRKVEGEGTA